MMEFYTSSTELYHHGILGQKWGVRRFQNPDGTRTAAGKRRERMRDDNPTQKESRPLSKSQKIKIGATAVSAAAITAGALYYATHKSEVNAFVKTAISELKYNAKYGNIAKGKEYVQGLGKAAKGGVKEGFDSLPGKLKEGISEGIGKTGKIVGVGVSMLAAKEVVDIIAGKQNAEKIYKANNKKKQDSFWKSYNDNFNNNKKKKDDDDDEEEDD